VTKAITAAVIAILNVNIRFRPLAHCSFGAKRDRGATDKRSLVADVREIAERAKANLVPFVRHSSLLTLAKLCV
jgi:hypothetical protein